MLGVEVRSDDIPDHTNEHFSEFLWWHLDNLVFLKSNVEVIADFPVQLAGRFQLHSDKADKLKISKTS